jgi:hypothetical protein
LLILFSTDVWALGSCLYQLAFLQNCFEEGSNLAILSRKYTIPEDNPYGEGLVELLDRMLTVDSKARADMTEVILCLSAVYSGRPLPPRKRSSKAKTEGEESKAEESVGTFRTDGQGIQETVYDPTKATVAKKLSSNSVAARRKLAAAKSAAKPPTAATSAPAAAAADPLDFGSFNEGTEGGDAGGADAFGAASFGEMTGKKKVLRCHVRQRRRTSKTNVYFVEFQDSKRLIRVEAISLDRLMTRQPRKRQLMVGPMALRRHLMQLHGVMQI